MPIGGKVTLRKARMYEFLDRLVNIALPRVRDFRGLNPKSFDGRGNYAWASRNTSCSRRSTTTRSTEVWGMDIIVCTTAQTDDEARALLDGVQLPVPAVRAERLSNADTKENVMAKKSAIEKNKRRRRMAKQFAGRRARLKAIAHDKTQADGGALRGAAEAGRAAAQFGADAHPQPLRADRPSARAITASSRCRVSRCAISAPRA